MVLIGKKIKWELNTQIIWGYFRKFADDFSFADTKNSVGLAGCIEEIAHNAIAVYWNPLESSAKVSDFLNLKFGKIGIDTIGLK